jgi:hypothetical protein
MTESHANNIQIVRNIRNINICIYLMIKIAHTKKEHHFCSTEKISLAGERESILTFFLFTAFTLAYHRNRNINNSQMGDVDVLYS